MAAARRGRRHCAGSRERYDVRHRSQACQAAVNRFDVGVVACPDRALRWRRAQMRPPRRQLSGRIALSSCGGDRPRRRARARGRPPSHPIRPIASPAMPEAIAFGRRLFFDPRFSPNGYIACVACHQPDRSFTDNLPRARGLAPVERNAIALQNLRRLRAGTAGAATSDSLWMASLRPILDAREIGGSAEKVAFVIETGDGVACRYRAAFGDDPSAHDAETVLVNVAKALAAYQETLVTGRTPFDDFRDALGARRTASVVLSARCAARAQDLLRARQLFRLPQGSQFHRWRVSWHRRCAVRRPGDVPTPGTSRVCRRCGQAASTFWDATTTIAAKAGASRRARRSRSTSRERGKWRTPSLRNVAVTAPYLHNGTARFAVRRGAPLREVRARANVSWTTSARCAASIFRRGTSTTSWPSSTRSPTPTACAGR